MYFNSQACNPQNPKYLYNCKLYQIIKDWFQLKIYKSTRVEVLTRWQLWDILSEWVRLSLSHWSPIPSPSLSYPSVDELEGAPDFAPTQCASRAVTT